MIRFILFLALSFNNLIFCQEVSIEQVEISIRNQKEKLNKINLDIIKTEKKIKEIKKEISLNRIEAQKIAKYKEQTEEKIIKLNTEIIQLNFEIDELISSLKRKTSFWYLKNKAKKFKYENLLNSAEIFKINYFFSIIKDNDFNSYEQLDSLVQASIQTNKEHEFSMNMLESLNEKIVSYKRSLKIENESLTQEILILDKLKINSAQLLKLLEGKKDSIGW